MKELLVELNYEELLMMYQVEIEEWKPASFTIQAISFSPSSLPPPSLPVPPQNTAVHANTRYSPGYGTLSAVDSVAPAAVLYLNDS